MPLCLKRLLPVYLWNVGVGGSSWIWYYRSIWLQHGRQHVQNSNMLNAVKVKVWLTDWPDDGYLLIHVSVMSPHEGINRTRPFFVHVRWAYMQAFGLCDECDCNISSFCRGVLLELNSLLRTFPALIIKKKRKDIFIKFWIEQFHYLMLCHHKLSWSSWYHAGLIRLTLTCGSVFWKKNTDLKCKTNHHSAQFNSALAAIALSCTSFGYRLLMLAENSERDGKTPIGRLNWVMLLFGEFHY